MRIRITLTAVVVCLGVAAMLAANRADAGMDCPAWLGWETRWQNGSTVLIDFSRISTNTMVQEQAMIALTKWNHVLPENGIAIAFSTNFQTVNKPIIRFELGPVTSTPESENPVAVLRERVYDMNGYLVNVTVRLDPNKTMLNSLGHTVKIFDDPIRVQKAILHEAGHTLGLSHHEYISCASQKQNPSVMNVFCEGGAAIPTEIPQCDIAGAYASYYTIPYPAPTPTPSVNPEAVFLGSADIEPADALSVNWWSSVSGPAPLTSTTPAGVHDHAWDATAGGRVFVNFPESTLTPSAGMRFSRTTDENESILNFNNHLIVAYVAGGNFRLLRGTTTLATSTGSHISLNTQFYISVTGVLHDTAGSFTCDLYSNNGTLLESIRGIAFDTLNGGGSAVSVVFATKGYWEDAWADSSGTLHGPAQVEILTPNAPGAFAQLARGGFDSEANFSQVYEMPVQIGGPGDDYVDATAPSQVDCYALTDLTLTQPQAVGVAAAVQRITGTPRFKFMLHIGGSSYEGLQTFTAAGSGNKLFGEYWANNPATGGTWTVTEVNNAQACIKWLDANGRVRGLYAPVLGK